MSVQLAPAARVAGGGGHPFADDDETANCAGEPDIEMPLISSAAVPPLVKVSARAALVDPTASSPNDSAAADAESVAEPPVPIPLSTKATGLAAALCVIERPAIFVPLLSGVKVTLSVQLPPAASVAGASGQALLDGAEIANCAASPPSKDTSLIVSAAVPPFAMSNERVALVRTACESNESPTGEIENDAEPPVPVPDRTTDVVPTLCTIESVALFAPLLVGMNVALNEQLAPAASVAGAVGHALEDGAKTANCSASAPPSEMVSIIRAAVPPFVMVNDLVVLVVLIA